MASSLFQIYQPPLCQWHSATWDDYLRYRDDPAIDRARLFFSDGWLWVNMGSEGINHSSFRDLFVMLLAFWFGQRSEQTASSFGGCQIEKPGIKAAAPDLTLYIGEGFPRWQSGESRYIDLNQWRVPDLVGEIADTTLADDLDQKKQIYAALQIPEYWVINVQGKQIFAFRLQPDGKYQQIDQSIALSGLPIGLLEQTLDQLSQGTNISAGLWFSQQITNLK